MAAGAPPIKHGILTREFTSLNVSDGDHFAECRPLFDVNEAALRTLCDFVLLFSSSGVALLVAEGEVGDVVAIAQTLPVIDLEAAMETLPEGWKREGDMIYTLAGNPADAVDVIRHCGLNASCRQLSLSVG